MPPEDFNGCLLVWDGDEVYEAIWTLDEDSNYFCFVTTYTKDPIHNVIAWMELPQPPKMCINCKHGETMTSNRISIRKVINVERFEYCSLHEDDEELNNETQQLCNDWVPRKNGGR